MNLANVSTLYQLFLILRKVGEVRGMTNTYNGDALCLTIVEVVNGSTSLRTVTRANGLRNKVAGLMDQEQRPLVDWFLLYADGSLPPGGWPIDDWPVEDWLKPMNRDEADEAARECTTDHCSPQSYIENVLEYAVEILMHRAQ